MAMAIKNTTERRYHNTKASYVLPNDAIEQNRLDSQAAAIVEMIGGAPFLGAPKILMAASKAIDVGCGTGVATIQLAHMFPSTKVYGIDLSPIPEAALKMAPTNVSFAEGNVLEIDLDKPGDGGTSREIFTRGGVDYIFGRMLFLGISDWKQYFTTTAQLLKSGGIIEHQDLDWKFYRVASSECLSDKWSWCNAVVQAAEDSGLSTRAGSAAAQFMKEAGLEIISIQTFEFSFTSSSKTPNSQAMGRYVQEKLIPVYPELLRKMLGSRVEGEDLKQLTADCLRDLSSEDGVHQKYTVTVGRKP